MNYLEIAGTAVGLLYLWLEYRASVWLWIAGIVMPVIYIFVYYDAGLYADLGISIYYVLASIYGIVCWLWSGKSDSGAPDKESVTKEITLTPRNYWIPIVTVTILLSLLLGFLLHRFTDSTVPWADGFTTGLSIVAMWMLAQKYLEQWIVWIVADIGCSILYVYKDLWFTSMLYLLYAVVAVAGYRKWKRMISS